MTEKSLLNEIMISASKFGNRLFRNNIGLGWVGTGKPVRTCKPSHVLIYPGDIVLRKARPLHSGLCKGSSDLIGWTKVKITQDMVGKDVAMFTGVEIKIGKDKESKIQQAFKSTVNKSGGLAIIARQLKDYDEQI